MKQLGLDDSGFVKQPKKTRKAQFLAEMDRVVPWSRLVAPHYPKPGKRSGPRKLDRPISASPGQAASLAADS